MTSLKYQARAVSVSWARLSLSDELFEKGEYPLKTGIGDIIASYLDCLAYPSGNQQLKGHTSPVNSAAVSSDGLWLFTGSTLGEFIHWDMMTGSMVYRWNPTQAMINDLDFHSDLLASVSGSQLIHIWDPFSHGLLHTLKGHTMRVMSVRFSEDGQTLVSGSADTTVRVWRLMNDEMSLIKKWKCVSELNGNYAMVTSVMINGDRIISGSWDNRLKVWNLTNKDMIHRFTLDGQISSMSINSDQTLIAVATEDRLVLYRWPNMELIDATSEIIKIKSICEDSGISPFCVCFHPYDSHILAWSDSENNEIIIYDLHSGIKDVTIPLKNYYARRIIFTPDGSRMVSVSLEHTVRVWDLVH